ISACVTISLAEKYYGDYQVGIIVGIAAITILYCCVSFILDIAIQCKCREQRSCCVVAHRWLLWMADQSWYCYYNFLTYRFKNNSTVWMDRGNYEPTGFNALIYFFKVCCGIEVALFIAMIAIYLTQWVGYYIRRH
ncbi:hypothetical protein Tsp_15200, partial [Trichinella spiralis]|uniref:hypothetical protein n=1 Tax=Trichinella spiralis TaxID=6334 RepID=UPI0001EFE2BD